ESDSGFRPFGSTGDAPGGGKKSREVYRRRSEARHRFGIELVSSPASSVAARRGTAVFVGGDGQIQMVAGKAPVRRSRKKIYSLALRQRAHRSGIIQYRTGEGSGIDFVLGSLESEMEGPDRLHGPTRRRRARRRPAALLSSGAWV